MGMQPQQGSIKGGGGPTWGQGFNQTFPYVQPQYSPFYGMQGGGQGAPKGGGGMAPQAQQYQPMGVKGGGGAGAGVSPIDRIRGGLGNVQGMFTHGQNYANLQNQGQGQPLPGLRA